MRNVATQGESGRQSGSIFRQTRVINSATLGLRSQFPRKEGYHTWYNFGHSVNLVADRRIVRSRALGLCSRRGVRPASHHLTYLGAAGLRVIKGHLSTCELRAGDAEKLKTRQWKKFWGSDNDLNTASLGLVLSVKLRG